MSFYRYRSRRLRVDRASHSCLTMSSLSTMNELHVNSRGFPLLRSPLAFVAHRKRLARRLPTNSLLVLFPLLCLCFVAVLCIPSILSLKRILLSFSSSSSHSQILSTQRSFSHDMTSRTSDHLHRLDILSVDYHERLQFARAHGRGPPVERYLGWLHIPKTGTSFVNTMLRWGCPQLPVKFFVRPRRERPANLSLPYEAMISWDWLFGSEEGHAWLRRECGRRLTRIDDRTGMRKYAVAMHAALRRNEAGCTAALFRNPGQRTMSNYLHVAYHYKTDRMASQSLQEFVRKTRFHSQQAKLLLGRHYRDERIVSGREARYAGRMVIHDLAFVGLTERFELSVRLFHAMFGGIPHRAQFANVRPSLLRVGETPKGEVNEEEDGEGRMKEMKEMKKQKWSEMAKRWIKLKKDGWYDVQALNGWRDEADEIVYSAARRRFWADVRRWKEVIEADGLGEVVVDAQQL